MKEDVSDSVSFPADRGSLRRSPITEREIADADVTAGETKSSGRIEVIGPDSVEIKRRSVVCRAGS
jgi:hypothetical protein